MEIDNNLIELFVTTSTPKYKKSNYLTMSGKKIGYIRVSTLDQNHERQLEGIKLDKCFIDKASGRDMNRPQLEAMLNYVRDGDIIIVHSMDRLARNLDDLRKLVQNLTKQKIKMAHSK